MSEPELAGEESEILLRYDEEYGKNLKASFYLHLTTLGEGGMTGEDLMRTLRGLQEKGMLEPGDSAEAAWFLTEQGYDRLQEVLVAS